MRSEGAAHGWHLPREASASAGIYDATVVYSDAVSKFYAKTATLTKSEFEKEREAVSEAHDAAVKARNRLDRHIEEHHC